LPPPPFMPPPPVPPVALNGLSDEQLKELEKSERKAVEARIECLRNVRALLDASVRQIELYTTICQLSGEPGIQIPPGPSLFTAPPTSNATSTTATSEIPKADTAGPSTVKEETAPVASIVKVEPAPGPSTVKVVPAEPEIEHGVIDNDDESEPTDGNELRRRRLARLESQDGPDAVSTPPSTTASE